MTNCLIKNIPQQLIFETTGNPGTNFPFSQNDSLEENLCSVCLQENRSVPILSEDNEILSIYCFE